MEIPVCSPNLGKAYNWAGLHTFAEAPTSATFTGVPTGATSTTSTLVVNPASATADADLIWAGINSVAKFHVDEDGDLNVAGIATFASAHIRLQTVGNYSWLKNLGSANGLFLGTASTTPGLHRVSTGAGAYSQLDVTAHLDQDDVLIKRDVDLTAGGGGPYNEAGSLLHLWRDVTNGGTVAGNFLECSNDGATPLMSIDKNGAISTTTTITATGAWIKVDTAAQAYMVIDRGATTHRGSLWFRTAGVTDWVLGNVDSDLVAGSAGTEFCISENDEATSRFWIEPGGNIGIGTTGPDKMLEINKSTGGEIRLTYNDANGSATDYCDLVTDANGGLTITTVDSDGAVGNINLAPDGITTIGDGGAANYAAFAIDGTLSLAGTARVTKCHTFANQDLSQGGTKPDQVLLGNYIGWSYDIGDDSVFVFPVPCDWAVGTDITVVIRYYIDEAYGTANAEVRFDFDWTAVPADATEAVDGASATVQGADQNIPGTAKFLQQYSVGSIAGASLAASDEVGISFSRIALTAGANPTADPVVTCIGITYTADKLGV